MKKYLIEFLKDIGLEPTFLTMSISILVIITLTSIITHIILHKIILKSIRKIHKKRTNFLTSSLLESNLFQRLALVFQGLIVYWQTNIWVEKGYVYEVLLTISLIWISIFGLLATYSLIDKTFKTLHNKTQTPFFAMQSVIQSIKLIFGIICFIYIWMIF